jgi:ubiquinone/menaquinone biosynthesis C-methylase UbiE
MIDNIAISKLGKAAEKPAKLAGLADCLTANSYTQPGWLKGIKSLIWSFVYWGIAFFARDRRAKKSTIHFMNYGYVPLKDDIETKKLAELTATTFTPDDEEVRTHIQLYEHVLSLVLEYDSDKNNWNGLTGLDLLEVGCGHGSGLEWVSKAHPELRSIRGIDRSIVNSLDGRVSKGDALSIPFPNECFDIVLNVETSHCYADQKQFLSECSRILRANGHLVWADLRNRNDLKKVFEDASKVGLKLRQRNDITKNVLLSLDQQHERYERLVHRYWWITKVWPSAWEAFYAKPGTVMYAAFTSRNYIYTSACWQKNK